MIEAGGQRPAGLRVGLDPLEFALGHAGIMLERHRRDGLLPLARIAHGARERDDGAEIGAAGRQPAHLGADVEILGLNADHGTMSLSAARDGWKKRDLFGAGKSSWNAAHASG